MTLWLSLAQTGDRMRRYLGKLIPADDLGLGNIENHQGVAVFELTGEEQQAFMRRVNPGIERMERRKVG